MTIVPQFIWPLILALVTGFITGVLFTLVFGQKIRVFRKISLAGIMIGSIICGVFLMYTVIEYGNNLAKRIFWREVKIIKDIDLQKDYFFNKESKIKGIIKEGSVVTQTFSKGQAVYMTFGTVVDRSHVEKIK